MRILKQFLFFTKKQSKVDNLKNSEFFKSAIAIYVGFFALGFFFGIWGALVPVRFLELNLSEWQLSLVLLIAGSSLTLAMLFVSKYSTKLGTKIITRCSTPFYGASFFTIMVTQELWLFYSIAIFIGFSAGCLDCSLNIQATNWEMATKKRKMSSFHALYSVGTLVGSGYTLLLLALDFSVLFITFPPIFLLGVFYPFLGSYLLNDKQKVDSDKQKQKIGLELKLFILFALLIFLATTIEGGIIDWSALYLVKELQSEAKQAGFIVLVFSFTIALGRFCGDWLVSKFSTTKLLVYPMLLSGCLLILAAVLKTTFFSYIAVAILGFGVANAFPFIVSEVAQATTAVNGNRARAVSIIVGFAYVGIITGPLLLGLIGELKNLNWTVATLGVMAICFAFLKLRAPTS